MGGDKACPCAAVQAQFLAYVLECALQEEAGGGQVRGG
jgi:hypothetical protein